MSWLTDPFAFAFFPRALLAGALVGLMCGTLGVFVVLRRMSYIGHGLSQSVLGGVAVALLLGQGVYVGAAGATLLAALAINWVGRRRGLHADAAIGIVSTAMFAAGVVVISTNRGLAVNLPNLLFGNVLGVGTGDIAVLAVVAVLLAATLFVFYKPLVFATFDPAVASAHGVRAGAMEIVFNIATAAVVVVSVRVVGVLLIAAAVVVPAAVGRLVTRSFGPLLATGAGVGVVTAVVGLFLSYHVNVASGPAIVLTGTVVFAVAALATSLSAGSAVRRARREYAATP
jgi:ABC-type Mn2+/Zn2+ transport system permease subunit